MRQINVLSNDFKQTFVVPFNGYESASISLEFKPQQYAWFISIVWSSWGCTNERISVSPNLLRQWHNILPFGILIAQAQGIDPFSQDAWINGWEFHILDVDDLPEVEALYVR